jgi:hypothetical protein
MVAARVASSRTRERALSRASLALHSFIVEKETEFGSVVEKERSSPIANKKRI